MLADGGPELFGGASWAKKARDPAYVAEKVAQLDLPDSHDCLTKLLKESFMTLSSFATDSSLQSGLLLCLGTCVFEVRQLVLPAVS